METEGKHIHDAIREVDDAFAGSFGRGDAAGMADLYTEGGMLLPPGSDLVKGRQAIRDFWQGVMDMGITELALETVEVDHQGEAAIEVGLFRLSGAGGEVMDEGKYLVIWKQEGGEWKAHRDTWNSSRPAPES